VYTQTVIARLTGRVSKLREPQIVMETSGTGYLVSCPTNLWADMEEGSETTLSVATYVREDRLDLFGFRNFADREFFLQLLQCGGIGPKTALAILSVPRADLIQAVLAGEAKLLSGIKGIGPKLASKVLVELKSLLEKGVLVAEAGELVGGASDQEAVEALSALGFDLRTILAHLREAPKKLKSTEEKVKYVLKNM
jgi:Holliday junction DNA helicase RuvA